MPKFHLDCLIATLVSFCVLLPANLYAQDSSNANSQKTCSPRYIDRNDEETEGKIIERIEICRNEPKISKAECPSFEAACPYYDYLKVSSGSKSIRVDLGWYACEGPGIIRVREWNIGHRHYAILSGNSDNRPNWCVGYKALHWSRILYFDKNLKVFDSLSITRYGHFLPSVNYSMDNCNKSNERKIIIHASSEDPFNQEYKFEYSDYDFTPVILNLDIEDEKMTLEESESDIHDILSDECEIGTFKAQATPCERAWCRSPSQTLIHPMLWSIDTDGVREIDGIPLLPSYY